ncbi:hypothetical protein PC116_g20944 [Phytophthora cactorum]|uniref:Uncharacterized protein n=1 Tax=Phytophthora cactorum TaxID=29920 RepID=A0A8T0YQ12_9STRA|nr:hypothetical protein Pcac1_g12981 [Phytophthora cactorum]KAG2800675.1 hypothetical protein PC112_g20370 [Phytophthora cactorum]KAG2810142.1 hypothetical protein PC111_g15775 [Phytophthora cactorum]KAG2841858.1 hypothetical protein PC113_g18943 [Phytophthora cactorum]KAG2879831.1 hypothetical protein PC114_g22369 [Phytophthora cactorum]
MIHAGKQLLTPPEDDTAFPYCDVGYQDKPFYIHNNKYFSGPLQNAISYFGP